MQAPDFTALSPGRLVSTVEGAIAFVPHPAPRTLPLDLTTVRLLGEAENALGCLAGTTRRLLNPYLVASPLLRREAILSSRIEGTITTPEQLVLLEATGSTPDPTEDTKEVRNYILAMQLGLDKLNEIPVCLRLIKDVHARLLQGVRGEREMPGEFRITQNFIGREGSTIAEARYVPPPVGEMLMALDDFEKYLNDEKGDLPTLIRVAIAHYQFEAIHPFRDGNGRIGRLLIPLILCSRTRIKEPVLYLSSYFERHDQLYRDLLLKVSQEGDWTAWIQFFLTAVRECADEAIAQCEGLLALRDRYRENFKAARSSVLLYTIIDNLFLRPSITIGEATKLLRVTDAAASSNIKKLVKAGILTEITGKKRNQVFLAPEILAFMRDAEETQGSPMGAAPKSEPTPELE